MPVVKFVKENKEIEVPAGANLREVRPARDEEWADDPVRPADEHNTVDAKQDATEQVAILR